VKHLQNAVAGEDRVITPGFAAQTVAKRNSMVAWRKRSAIAIEKILAWHLTQARNRANLSQSALAKAVGRPQSFVAKIEMKYRPVKAAELVQLCVAMDQDPCELLMTVVQARSVQSELALMEALKSSRTLQRNAVYGNTPEAPRLLSTRAFDAHRPVIRRSGQRGDERRTHQARRRQRTRP
jgi:transcriptional regulator with XRE-family HTH domain